MGMRLTMSRRRLFLLGLLGLVFALSAAAHAVAREKEKHCTWKEGISPERLAASDAALYALRDPRMAEAMKEHLPFGKPKRVDGKRGSGEVLLGGPYFLLHYDNDLRAPIWTAHHLTREEAAISPRKSPQKAEKRRDSFRSDPRLAPDGRSFCSDYEEKVYDQGHMVPNADLDWIEPAIGHSVGMDHSFLMSNMTPQHCEFNRGIWQVLEGMVRKWASAEDAPDTWIITGAIYDRDGTPGRDKDAGALRMVNRLGIRSVAVPSHQYKIIVQRVPSGLRSLSFVLANDERLITSDERKGTLEGAIRTLDQIAELSGLRFLHGESVSESSKLWAYAGGMPALLTRNC